MDRHANAATARLHPALWAALAGLAVLLVAFVPVLWSMWTVPPVLPSSRPAQGTPWAVETLPAGGTRVFGLRLPGGTLADAQAIFGDELQLALMATRGQAAVLEASVESARPGGVQGRLLLTADAAAPDLQRWRDRAAKETPVSAETRRIALRSDDHAEALRTPLLAVGFIPAAQLDAATLRVRFGAPAEVLPAGPAAQHWLYPRLGLAILLDAQGRELLQYVAPADFERRLRVPLLTPASTPASDPPG